MMMAVPVDPLVMALLAQLVRSGTFTAADIDEMATDLEAAEEHEAAGLARAAYVEAMAPTPSEWAAERARRTFRIVDTDGGNEPG